MTAEAMAQAFTRMLKSEEYSAEVAADAVALDSFDLSDGERKMLTDAAAEGIMMMGEDEGGSMKRIAAELQSRHGQISDETQAALGRAVQERIRSQLDRVRIDPQTLKV